MVSLAAALRTAVLLPTMNLLPAARKHPDAAQPAKGARYRYRVSAIGKTAKSSPFIDI
jgi:hypothetical protein